MARIELGHTGRDSQQHSRLLAPIFMSLIVAFVARALLPMIAFALFVWVYAPVLVKPRADGMRG